MSLQEMPVYGSIAAAKEAGLSLRQLYYWVDVLRVVQPQMRQSGLRAFRRFTERDLRILKEMRGLVEHGYTLQAAMRMVRQAAATTTHPNTALGSGFGVEGSGRSVEVAPNPKPPTHSRGGFGTGSSTRALAETPDEASQDSIGDE